MGITDLGRLRGDHEVAHQGHFQAAAAGNAVQCGNHRLGQRVEYRFHFRRHIDEGLLRTGRRGGIRQRTRQISARTECPAFTGQHDDSRLLPVAQLNQGRAQLAHAGNGNSIQGLRSVQIQPGDRAAMFNDEIAV